eukprot:g26475.t1
MQSDANKVEAKRQLSNTSSYLPLDHEPTMEHQSIVSAMFTGSSRLLFTMDMQSIYMDIPHQEGLRTLHIFLAQRPEPFPNTTTLCLAKLVLTLNYFSFNSSHFLQ